MGHSLFSHRTKPYITAFRMRITLELQYRAAAFGGFVTQLAFGLMLIFLYQALYRSGGDTSVPIAQVITYVWLQQAFFRVLFSGDNSLSQDIISGNIAYHLVKPLDQYSYWYVRSIAGKVTGAAMRALPMLLAACLMPAQLRIEPPASLGGFLLFLGSLCLGVLTISAIDNIQSCVTMRTLDPRGIATIITFTSMLFSGNLLPLTLFPDRWQRIVRFQPFAQTLDLPIRLYTGIVPEGEILLSIGIQVLWLVGLILAGRLFWSRNTRRITVQGG